MGRRRQILKKHISIASTIIVIVLILTFIIGVILYTHICYQKIYNTTDELISSFDGKFGYIQLSSPKKRICSINIYEIIDNNGYSDVMLRSATQEYFRDFDMKNIQWGNGSYDLYFDSADVGKYCFVYMDNKWEGPAYLRNNDGVYYLWMPENNNPSGKVLKSVSEETIPDWFK